MANVVFGAMSINRIQSVKKIVDMNDEISDFDLKIKDISNLKMFVNK